VSVVKNGELGGI